MKRKGFHIEVLTEAQQRVLRASIAPEKTKMPRMLNATTWEKVKADLIHEVGRFKPGSKAAFPRPR